MRAIAGGLVAGMAGGAAEMATMGERYGALVDRVAFAHSARMLLVVTLVPVGITLAGFSATEDYRPLTMPFEPLGFATLAGLRSSLRSR